MIVEYETGRLHAALRYLHFDIPVKNEDGELVQRGMALHALLYHPDSAEWKRFARITDWEGDGE